MASLEASNLQSLFQLAAAIGIGISAIDTIFSTIDRDFANALKKLSLSINALLLSMPDESLHEATLLNRQAIDYYIEYLNFCKSERSRSDDVTPTVSIVATVLAVIGLTYCSFMPSAQVGSGLICLVLAVTIVPLALVFMKIQRVSGYRRLVAIVRSRADQLAMQS